MKREQSQKCVAVLHRDVVEMRHIWNIFSPISTANEDISKMKDSSKSNFRPPPHCGCEANVPSWYFDMHFVFAEIESNAIARHYSSPFSTSLGNAFFFIYTYICARARTHTCVIYIRMYINSAIAQFNFARVARRLHDMLK